MARYNTSRVVPITLLLIVVAVSIAALVSIGRAIFFPNATPDGAVSQTQVARDNLLNTATDHSVRMYVRGEVVGAEDFRAYEITVSPESRLMVIYKGYSGAKIREIRLGNSPAAYEQFVYALDEAGILNGRELSDDQNDTRGLCADGQLYSFDIRDGDRVVRNVWTTSCRDFHGSLNDRPSDLRDLFVGQIPDGKLIVSKIDL